MHWRALGTMPFSVVWVEREIWPKWRLLTRMREHWNWVHAVFAGNNDYEILKFLVSEAVTWQIHQSLLLQGSLFCRVVLYFAMRFFILLIDSWFCRVVLYFAMRFFILLIDSWFCREILYFAMRFFILPIDCCFCREILYFAMRFFILPLDSCFCREILYFAMRFFILPIDSCFCREILCFAVRFFILLWPWFCREILYFAVTLLGHRSLVCYFPALKELKATVGILYNQIREIL